MSQSLSQIWIHIIFSTKNRYAFMKEPFIQQRIHDYIKSICKNQRCEPLAVGGIEDHVHILASLYKNLSLSKLVEEIKKSSSKWIKTLPGSSEGMLAQFYWQNGYGAFSVSQSNLAVVKTYIENQKQHHQKQNFQDELRAFFKRYNVNYDEKYIWN